MDLSSIKKPKNLIILGVLALSIIVAIWLRLLPESGLVSATGVNLLGNDPWYSLRQVEVIINNFPAYPWFEPMTQFPTGHVVDWGPFFALLTSAVVLVSGASLRPDIMYVASWVPVLLAAVAVPVVYLLGERLYNWKCGIIGAFFVAIVGGQYFYRSLFGFVDHHIAEALLSTLFILAYVVTLEYCRTHPVSLSARESLKIPALLAAITGIVYVIGYFNMPTMVLFALVIAVYTLIQFLWDGWKKTGDDSLPLINTVLFVVAILGVFAIGFNTSSLSMISYSIGHVLAYVTVILGTLVLYGIKRYLSEKPPLYYPVSIFGLIILVTIVLGIAVPEVYNQLIGNLIGFFAQPATTLTVQEARAWSLESAWLSFSYGLILFVAGIFALLYSFWKKNRNDHLFVIVWSLLIFFSTWQHVRYEYYLAVNIAVISAFFIAFALDFGWNDLMKICNRQTETKTVQKEEPTPTGKNTGKSKGKKAKSKQTKPAAQKKATPDYLRVLPFVIAVLFGLMFVGSSVATDFEMGNGMKYGGMNADWHEALAWFGQNSPETGVDYYAEYDQDEFTYPPKAYGVMSWWDYGHWITFISKRIPNANPFQGGVTGETGAAAFFVNQDEKRANTILDKLGTDYVITDVEMDTGKFAAMETWYDVSYEPTVQHLEYLLAPVSDSEYQSQILYNQNYFETMVSRLHNFDGSMVDPEQVLFIQYADGSLAGTQFPVITGASYMSPAEAEAALTAFSQSSQPGRSAAIIGADVLTPPEKVPALHNYRLVHESPSSAITKSDLVVKYVKIFEYVPGAHISGEGTIALDVETNTGRQFTYLQESTDGEFVVPYTSDGTGEVHALGPYTILETGQTFAVSDEAIMNGLTLN